MRWPRFAPSWYFGMLLAFALGVLLPIPWIAGLGLLCFLIGWVILEWVTLLYRMNRRDRV